MNDWCLCIGNLKTWHEFERIKLFDLDINQTTLCEEWVQGIYDVTISLEVVLIVHLYIIIQMLYATEKIRGAIKTLINKNEYVLFVDNPESYHLKINLF